MRWMNIRKSRGDKFKSRYLTSIELKLINIEFKLDYLSGKIGLYFISLLGYGKWRILRGSKKRRKVKILVENFSDKAAAGLDKNYDKWLVYSTDLYESTLKGNIHKLSPQEIDQILEDF